MITSIAHSNLVILADGIKNSFQQICYFSEKACSEMKSRSTNRQLDLNELLEINLIKSNQRYAEINSLMYCAYFLESYINMFEYQQNAASPGYVFENFSNLPTHAKWLHHFPNETAFIAELDQIFFFRNFLAHSKPLRRNGDTNEVYVKGNKTTAGWKPVRSTSKYVQDDTGLMLNHFDVELIAVAIKVVNDAVRLGDALTPGFSGHYNLGFEPSSLSARIRTANAEFNQNAKAMFERNRTSESG